MTLETVRRIEPARPEQATEAVTDAIADLVGAATKLALAGVVDAGLLASGTPKGGVSLRFPADTLDVLFPRLFAEA